MGNELDEIENFFPLREPIPNGSYVLLRIGAGLVFSILRPRLLL